MVKYQDIEFTPITNFPGKYSWHFLLFFQAMKLRNKLKKTDSGLKGAYAHEEDSYIEIIIP